MKNHGLTFIEVIVSLALFSICIFPLMRYSHNSFSLKYKFIALEKDLKNFKAIEKQLMNIDIKIFEKNFGKHQYNYSNFLSDSLTREIFLPYELSKEAKIEIEISSLIFRDENAEYPYTIIDLMYTNNNKTLKSSFIAENLEER